MLNSVLSSSSVSMVDVGFSVKVSVEVLSVMGDKVVGSDCTLDIVAVVSDGMFSEGIAEGVWLGDVGLATVVVIPGAVNRIESELDVRLDVVVNVSFSVM